MGPKTTRATEVQTMKVSGKVTKQSGHDKSDGRFCVRRALRLATSTVWMLKPPMQATQTLLIIDLQKTLPRKIKQKTNCRSSSLCAIF